MHVGPVVVAGLEGDVGRIWRPVAARDDHPDADGTDFRWGDGSGFDKIAPDTIPLALEFRHTPAYSLRPPAHDGEPSGWPWGPRTNRSLDDPASFARLPLVRLFDGIGMIVARSDWSPDATYVTFKAG